MAGAFRVDISVKAKADLRGIFDYLAAHSPERAKQVVDDLLVRIRGLAIMPARFKTVATSTKGTPIHSMAVSPYVIHYRIGRDLKSVMILRVRHGRRRPPTRFR